MEPSENGNSYTNGNGASTNGNGAHANGNDAHAIASGASVNGNGAHANGATASENAAFGQATPRPRLRAHLRRSDPWAAQLLVPGHVLRPGWQAAKGSQDPRPGNRPYPRKKKVYVLENRCPHRGIPLHNGKFEFEGCITCIYHGWTFDLGSGQMVAALVDGPDSPMTCRPTTDQELPGGRALRPRLGLDGRRFADGAS